MPVEQLVARKVPAPLIALLRRTLAATAQRPASARELMELLRSLRRKLARHRTVILVSLGLFLICAAGLTSYLLQRRHAMAGMLPEKSVAVLPFENLSKGEANATMEQVGCGKDIAVSPFENLSEDKQNVFFADGLQDDVLTV